jgi:hypothetical protein
LNFKIWKIVINLWLKKWRRLINLLNSREGKVNLIEKLNCFLSNKLFNKGKIQIYLFNLIIKVILNPKINNQLIFKINRKMKNNNKIHNIMKMNYFKKKINFNKLLIFLIKILLKIIKVRRIIRRFKIKQSIFLK